MRAQFLLCQANLGFYTIRYASLDPKAVNSRRTELNEVTTAMNLLVQGVFCGDSIPFVFIVFFFYIIN